MLETRMAGTFCGHYSESPSMPMIKQIQELLGRALNRKNLIGPFTLTAANLTTR